ncbi:Protease Do-like chloroplastic isoform B [Micractinium conductrix]|uniref:Protease Do-like chloroplastic isoform B n=1 Tax=Micractinium conductrix TaxID=554055 RepID=A0A2P6VGY9_9CHLO|nr:Protease Do-like chloroplastic isoform B [Micractinium conductrix]|eukprot:PSC73356.1 Protease Do-like chloroplastic isoform B [Micractinium conductrix]
MPALMSARLHTTPPGSSAALAFRPSSASTARPLAQRPRCQQQQEREPWQPTQPTQQSQQPQQLAEEVWWHRHRRPLAATLAALAAVTPLLLGLPIDVADARAVLTAEERNTIGLFQRSRPSVVYITSLTTRRDAFTLNMLEIPQGEGSGFVYDKNGHIVTNYHVIRGASDVLITLAGGKGQPAKVVGYDEDKDVAVLQIDMKEMDGPLVPLPLGTSSDLEVGQKVFAIGNPFGLDHTLTTGVISGTGREINSGNTGRPIQDVIQTDAAINPGNSGGPLLDSGGAMIGINTAIYSQSGNSAGVGFAIPVDVVKSSVEQIITFGKVVRPIMGISFAPDQSKQLGVNGVLVLNARDGGPASKAGIKGSTRDEYGRLVLGDIILAIDGTRINSASDLYRILDKCSVGDKLDVEVLRADSKEHVVITLEASA